LNLDPRAQAVFWTAVQGFITGAILSLLDALSNTNADTINMTWLRALGFSVLTAGIAGAVSALHNFPLGRKGMPKLQPNPPVVALPESPPPPPPPEPAPEPDPAPEPEPPVDPDPTPVADPAPADEPPTDAPPTDEGDDSVHEAPPPPKK
jgi:outer membrane biosynthesis protein TonB